MKDPAIAIVFQTEVAYGILSGLSELNLIKSNNVAMIGYGDLEIAKMHRLSLSVLQTFARDARMRFLKILIEVIKVANPLDFQ